MITTLNAPSIPGPMFSGQTPKVIHQASKRIGLTHELVRMMGMSREDARKPYARILTPEQFKVLWDNAACYVGAAEKIKLDFNKQAAILIHPQVMTPTSMAWLETDKLTYDAKTGLNVEIGVKLPQDAATRNNGNPSLLVIVDKKWVDKGVIFNVKGEYPCRPEP